MPNFQNWKTDNYTFVGKAFDIAYANRLNKLLAVVGEVNTNSIDYELTGSGGYGELIPYNGILNEGHLQRAFKTIITPEEFSLSIGVDYKLAKVDKMGQTRKVGTKLGDSAAMTVYLHLLRMFSNAFNTDGLHNGGDGKPWAASDHPNASKGSSGRRFIVDPDSGTYSNLISSALSVSAITTAQSMASRYVTPDGLPFLCEMDTLLVSPELEATAQQICGENSKLYPGQTSDVNTVSDMKYIVIGGGQDGFGPNAWAVCDRRIMKELVNIVYITRPKVLQSQLDNPLKDMYTAYVDFGVGWGDARQIIFSTGA